VRCFQCQTENERDSRFCKNCGKSFVRGDGRREQGPREEYPNKQGVAALALLKRRKDDRYNVTLLVGIVIALVFLTAAYFFESFFSFIAAFFGIIISLIIGAKVSCISESEYSALPGARDLQSSLRCIHCGNRGIWKRTPYRTNSTIAACSKCKEDLYTE
jgi:hypothetical protein